MLDVRERVAEYSGLGYDPIPLYAGTKEAACKGWQRLAPSVQWANAPDDCNIGLRGGGELHAAYVDCDDRKQPGTAAHVQRILAGMGYMPDGDFPFIVGASGVGGHVYVRLTQALEGDWRNLRREVGAGELRYGPGAYVVAPGSMVDGREYIITSGDLRQLPALELADVRQFISVDVAPKVSRPAQPPRLAQALLRGDAATIGRYPSRSEAEQACMASLIGAGYDFADVLTLFLTHPVAGKFWELRQQSEKNALRWLRHSYDRAHGWSDAHESPGRTQARQAQAWALATPWPGRTGSSDRAVFLAHTEIARQAGKLTYAASVRRLAELAGVGYVATVKANRRLLESRAIRCATAHAGTLASLYELTDMGRSDITSTQGGRVEVISLCPIATADAFRYRGLGKAALEVWQTLQQRPGMTAGELTDATGRNRKTVYRALQRMARIVDEDSGEVFRLVERDGDGWRALDSDLLAIARIVGTAGALAKQQAKHDEERRGFRRAIARARAADTPERST